MFKNTRSAAPYPLTTSSTAGRWLTPNLPQFSWAFGWLRHTEGSHRSDREVDLRHVRDNFGHASIATTNIGLHTGDEARHEAMQDKHRIGWTQKTSGRSTSHRLSTSPPKACLDTFTITKRVPRT
jgi:hypothetical protein